jgi:hypothetical protein
MNDHVHVAFAMRGAYSLPQVPHSWKSFTAHRMQRAHGRHGRVWQPEYFDRIVRDEREFAETVAYIVGNPYKRWPELIKYPWVWAID